MNQRRHCRRLGPKACQDEKGRGPCSRPAMRAGRRQAWALAWRGRRSARPAAGVAGSGAGRRSSEAVALEERRDALGWEGAAVRARSEEGEGGSAARRCRGRGGAPGGERGGYDSAMARADGVCCSTLRCGERTGPTAATVNILGNGRQGRGHPSAAQRPVRSPKRRPRLPHLQPEVQLCARRVLLGLCCIGVQVRRRAQVSVGFTFT